jgi:23S rRNA (cytosine1962-C5)-methyltransferase
MVFSESDFLPGLIIDKYNRTFVLQINSIGMQKNVNLITEILENEFDAKNIFTKNDFYLRKIEGLPQKDDVYLGKADIEIIDEGCIKYKIDFSQSQKTGFYFDQSDNRFFVEKIVTGKKVVDVFCNSGGFGLHALKVGAESVDFVDSSEREIDNVRTNLILNDLVLNTKCYVEDAFKFLEAAAASNRKFDVVMLDPPAFAKSKKNLHTAEKGYKKLNKLALQILNEGGYLVTSSCSHHVKKENFLNSISSSAVKASKKLQLIYFSGASLDHPRLPAMEETEYLKFAVFSVFALEKS